MWNPPRPIADTFSPVFPSILVGISPRWAAFTRVWFILLAWMCEIVFQAECARVAPMGNNSRSGASEQLPAGCTRFCGAGWHRAAYDPAGGWQSGWQSPSRDCNETFGDL